MIQNKSYNISNKILTNETLNSYITRFWDDIFKPLLKN